LIRCYNSEHYKLGEKVISIVYHSPIVEIGTKGKIADRWIGPLYTVRLPSGEFYKWLDGKDLDPVDTSQHILRAGDSAILNTNRHQHFYQPLLISGIVVRVIKVVETDYYDILIKGDRNHAWLAGFEISRVF